jgi:hypothetical protein
LYDQEVSDGTSSCPCGCGAELIGMVAERETGLRAETTGPAPVRKLPASEHSAAYLITGMPGAGKSTVARLLALHFDHAAHIDIDMVFHHFTVSGRAEPAASTAESRTPWTPSKWSRGPGPLDGPFRGF